MIPAGYEVIEGLQTESVTPLPKHVLLRWLKKEKTKAGVIIPQYRHRAGFMKAQVLALGEGVPEELAVGDLVLFNGLGEKEWLGVQDPADRDTVFFMRAENIYGIIGDGGSIRMLGAYMLVRPDEVKKESSGGVIIADPIRRDEQRRASAYMGEVVHAGPESGFSKGARLICDSVGSIMVRLGDHNDEILLCVDASDGTDVVYAEVN